MKPDGSTAVTKTMPTVKPPMTNIVSMRRVTIGPRNAVYPVVTFSTARSNGFRTKGTIFSSRPSHPHKW